MIKYILRFLFAITFTGMFSHIAFAVPERPANAPWCPPNEELYVDGNNYGCMACIKGYYTGPDGTTQFCCSADHLRGASASNGYEGNGSRARCENGQYVCELNTNIRTVEGRFVNNDGTIKSYDGNDYANWSCLNPFQVNAYNTNLPSGFSVNGCGAAGSGSANNTSFANCRISKTHTNKTGCKYINANNKVYESRKLTLKNYVSAGSGWYDIATGLFFNPAYVATSDWVLDSYTFTAQPGYKKNPNSGTCSICGPGTYSAGGDVDTCTPCASGTAVSGNGNTACDDCGPGTYASGSGNTTCSSCTGQRYSNGSRNSNCTTAPLNSSVNDAHTDYICINNTYRGVNPVDDEDDCLGCPISSFTGQNTVWGTADNGATSVSNCYLPGNGAGTSGYDEHGNHYVYMNACPWTGSIPRVDFFWNSTPDAACTRCLEAFCSQYMGVTDSSCADFWLSARSGDAMQYVDTQDLQTLLMGGTWGLWGNCSGCSTKFTVNVN